VVRQVADALVPGGHFVLDDLNAEQVRRTLRLSEAAKTKWENGGGGERRHDVRVTRRIGVDDRFVIKEIELRAEGRTFQERVRLYSADELAGLISDAGLRVEHRFGDYDGGRTGPEAPRVILIGVRS
jgi:hypothetical protein